MIVVKDATINNNQANDSMDKSRTRVIGDHPNSVKSNGSSTLTLDLKICGSPEGRRSLFNDINKKSENKNHENA